MKTLVTYKSKTGFTKKYAEWISSELGANLKESAKVSKSEVEEYDLVIHGGWIMAGMVSGLEKIRKMEPKKMIVFGVGMTTKEEAEIKNVVEANKLGETSFFYYEGGLYPKKMGIVGRTMVKMVTKRTLVYCDHTNKNEITELINRVMD